MTASRPAARDDVPQIVALLADDVLGQGREISDLEVYLDAFDAVQREGGNQILVAEENGVVIATYQLTFIAGLSLAAARRAQVESVRVAASHRGRGLGGDILVDAEQRARAAGCALIQLTSNAQREDALRFYETHGYVPSHVGFKRSLR